MNSVLNVSAYRFFPVADPHAWREELFQRARALELKGTILLAAEGINLFLAGAPDALRGFVASLQLQARESWSPAQPFRKLLVKVKREIIRMDHPAIQPAQGRAPALDAATAKRWLDQGCDDAGRPVVTLDTRNAFEVDYGTFDGALDWRLGKFSDFPRHLLRTSASWKARR